MEDQSKAYPNFHHLEDAVEGVVVLVVARQRPCFLEKHPKHPQRFDGQMNPHYHQIQGAIAPLCEQALLLRVVVAAVTKAEFRCVYHCLMSHLASSYFGFQHL